MKLTFSNLCPSRKKTITSWSMWVFVCYVLITLSCGPKKVEPDKTGADASAAEDTEESISIASQPEVPIEPIANVGIKTKTSKNAKTTDGILSVLKEPPPLPVILEPSKSFISTHNDLLNIWGSCNDESLVVITGAAEASCVCINKIFSFDINKSEDGIYDFAIKQVDSNGNDSELTLIQWVRDTKVPDSLGIISPSKLTHVSADTEFLISGSCERDASIQVAGDAIQEGKCLDGSFSITIEKKDEGIYQFELRQTDLAENTSLPITLEWSRTSEVPATPTIINPGKNPFYSSAHTLDLSGACISGYLINLSLLNQSNPHELPKKLSQTCTDSGYNFSFVEEDAGTYDISVRQTNPKSGARSEQAHLVWVLDDISPDQPIIEAPTTLQVLSKQRSLSLSGLCENEGTVYLENEENSERNVGEVCQNGHFSFNLSVNQDAINHYNIKQKDLALNDSPIVTIIWESDTTPPQKPAVLLPTQSNFLSNNKNLSINGNCETSALVRLSGDDSQVKDCINGNFSFMVTKNESNIYFLNISQMDRAGNESELSSLTWQLDLLPPEMPVLMSPMTNNYASGGSSFELAVICEKDSLVTLVDNTENQTHSCPNGQAEFLVTKTTDGLHHFAITQVDLAGNTSASLNISWLRDTTMPAPIIFTSPVQSLVASNSSSLDLKGTCTPTYRVEIASGVLASEVTHPSGSLDQKCSSLGTFQFTIEKSIDGFYPLALMQTNPNNLQMSATTIVSWIKDTINPLAPVITKPTINPFTSGNNYFNISGTCEDASTVFLTELSETKSMICNNSTFNFVVERTADGTYRFELFQKDLASNPSPQYVLFWTRNTSIPATPSIVTPATDVLYSNQNTLTINGTCDGPDYLVEIGGDLIESEVQNPMGSLSQLCQNNSYSYKINKPLDGNYTFNITQKNILTEISSPAESLVFIKDSTAPSAPKILNPSNASVTMPGILSIYGECEADGTVLLNGSDQQIQTCQDNHFEFFVTKNQDGVFIFSITQKDRALNQSAAANLMWTRDSNSIPAITLSQPLTSPYYDNKGEITVSGNCLASLTVNLGGDINASEVMIPGNSLTQVCSNYGNFSFKLKKENAGSFNLNLSQTNFSGSSPETIIIWTIDKVAPVISLTTRPDAINLSNTASFQLSSSEPNTTFYCGIDNDQSLNPCGLNITFSQLSNGTHNFYVYGVDLAGNTSQITAYGWEQNFRNTLALYHFNSATGSSLDSSLFTGSLNNSLTDVGSGVVAPAKYSEGRSFSSTATMNATHSATLAKTSSSMTVEGWMRFSTFPAKNAYAELISKTGTSGNYGWSVKVRRSSTTSFRLAMFGSLNGTSFSEVRSNNFTMSTNNWYFFAVTWNKGEVKFFLNGSLIGSGKIGKVGSAQLFSNNSNLVLGSLTQPFTGALDEIRISQSIRYTGAFSTPSTAFNPD